MTGYAYDPDGCPPHYWTLRCSTCGTEEPAGEHGAADALCWLFTALRHGGDLAHPETWEMHRPTAERAVSLLAERGWRLTHPRERAGATDD